MTIGIINPATVPLTSPVLTPDVDLLPPAISPAAVASMSLDGPLLNGVARMAPGRFIGIIGPMFGSELFGKIIVVPRVKALGYIVGTVEFDVLVWSTFDGVSKQLSAITETGTGGVIVSNPYGGLPLSLAPSQVRTFPFTVPQEGDTIIDQFVAFEVDGIDPDSTTVEVTGARLLIFAFDHDWSQGFSERAAFLTSVINAYTTAEQRIQLRRVARPVIGFRVFTTNAEATEELEALLTAWQAQPFGVPLWQDAQPLLADVTTGDLTVAVDARHRAFVPGGMAMLWRGTNEIEAMMIDAVDDFLITRASPAISDWPADGRTVILPLLRGRLPQQFEVRRTGDIAEADVIFDCEVTQ